MKTEVYPLSVPWTRKLFPFIWSGVFTVLENVVCAQFP